MLSDSITQAQAEEIYSANSAYVFRAAMILTKSRVLAEDAVQETFLRVFQKFDAYNAEKPLLPWIYKITVNVTRNLLRKQKWLTFIGDAPESGGVDFVEASVLKDEEGRELWAAVNELPLKHREIIVLHYYCDMKLKDISDILAIPLGTCKSRLNSALNSLRSSVSRPDTLEGGFTSGQF